MVKSTATFLILLSLTACGDNPRDSNDAEMTGKSEAQALFERKETEPRESATVESKDKSKAKDSGRYEPGTLGSGTADNAGQSMQGSIDRADAVGDGITTPAATSASGSDQSPAKPEKEPRGPD